MDVHLHCAATADHEQGVAELQELGLELVRVDAIALHEERRAVAELRQLLVDRLEGDRLEERCGRGQLLAAHVRGDAAHDLDQAGAPGVDDASLLEDVQLLRRPRQGDLAGGEQFGERVLDGRVVRRNLLRPLRQRARHRENRALLRVPHGRVARVAGPAQHAGDGT